MLTKSELGQVAVGSNIAQSKVNCHEVNWKTIYDLLYVFHINLGHNMHDSGDIAH